jgi:hypothetical protein
MDTQSFTHPQNTASEGHEHSFCTETVNEPSTLAAMVCPWGLWPFTIATKSWTASQFLNFIAVRMRVRFLGIFIRLHSAFLWL